MTKSRSVVISMSDAYKRHKRAKEIEEELERLSKAKDAFDQNIVDINDVLKPELEGEPLEP